MGPYMKNLMKIEDVVKLIDKGNLLLLSGSFDALSSLPRGNWIGATSSYFIDEDGGIKSNDQVFVVELPLFYKNYSIKSYTIDTIEKLAYNYFDHGFSYILMPAFSPIHYSYAERCLNYIGIFQQPLIGWIAGFDLDDVHSARGWVFDGVSGEKLDDRALVLHVSLMDGYTVSVDTVNLFEQGNGDILKFVNNNFIQKECYIRGELRNFYDYIVENECNLQLPLVSTVKDLQTNVSIKSLDSEKKEVHLYAPVFADQEYQFASPVGFYEDEFDEQIAARNLNPTISCNCILNYLYAQLEGKKTSTITCPMTFGEISHLLLNQTMVSLTVRKK